MVLGLGHQSGAILSRRKRNVVLEQEVGREGSQFHASH
jgi:hypothetical protein